MHAVCMHACRHPGRGITRGGLTCAARLGSARLVPPSLLPGRRGGMHASRREALGSGRRAVRMQKARHVLGRAPAPPSDDKWMPGGGKQTARPFLRHHAATVDDGKASERRGDFCGACRMAGRPGLPEQPRNREQVNAWRFARWRPGAGALSCRCRACMDACRRSPRRGASRRRGS